MSITLSPAATDAASLTAYAQTGDPLAFAALVQRYRQMVFATCMRVLHHEPDAEDAAQETFFKFARSALTIRGNAAAWLHACALGTSTDLLRKRGTQRRAELRVATSTDIPDESSHTWRDVEPLLDAALAQLSDEDRDAIIAHYLAGRPQKDLAKEANVSPGTMSRRIERALDALSTHLRAAGVVTLGAASLASALALAQGTAMPSASLASLGKLALADAAITGKRALVTSALSLKSVALIATTSTALLAGGLYLSLHQPSPGTPLPPPSTSPQYLATSQSVPRPKETSRLYYLADMTIDGTIASSFAIAIDPDKITFTSQRSIDGPLQTVVMERLSTTTQDNTSTVRVKISTIDSLGDDPFVHALGKQATFKAVRRNDRLTLTLDVDDFKTNMNPMLVRRIKPADASAAEPILGTWGQVADWQLELSRDTLRILATKDFTLQNFRILNWQEAVSESCSKLEVICTDNVADAAAIGKRFKMLIRQDPGGFTLAHHDFLSKRTSNWPTFDPKKGDEVRVMVFTKEQP
jgi:RNA polymerase sigma factor (sigma-70 family)